MSPLVEALVGGEFVSLVCWPTRCRWPRSLRRRPGWRWLRATRPAATRRSARVTSAATASPSIAPSAQSQQRSASWGGNLPPRGQAMVLWINQEAQDSPVGDSPASQFSPRWKAL